MTAGHVDHGKSTLVEWLTGTHPDRLAEERRRGLTIDLGFASTVLASGTEVGLVDVPGHVRFLKNMLAGMGAVEACLFVVAATEGWKPQSEDHLRILEVAGARYGVVAITHAGLVPAEAITSVRQEVAAHLEGTFLHGAPMVAVDVPAAIGTEGPDGLRAAIEAMVSQVPGAPDLGRPRLWLDRSFAVRGAGTVVTGTLAGGCIVVGDQLVVASGRAAQGGGWATVAPAVRVRGLESYGRHVERAEPGRRLAVNLSGFDHRAVARGDALLRAAQWHRCCVADASLGVVAGLEHPVSRRGAYLAHIGTGEQAVRLRVLGRAGAIEPGAVGTVRMWLSAPLPLAPGDRYILRDAGRQQVIGGGTLLDVAPVLPASRATPSVSVPRVVAERGWVEAEELERLTGAPATPTLGRWVVDPGTIERTRQAVLERVRAAGPSGLDVSVLDERQRAVIATVAGIVVSHGIARLASGRPAAHAAPATTTGDPQDSPEPDLLVHPYLRRLQGAPFSPPPPDGVDRNDLRRLVRSGLVIEAGGVWFAASAVAAAASALDRLLEVSPDGVRVSDVRDALGTSRRFTLAILSYFDTSGITRRRDDLRIAGPRLRPLLEQSSPQ